MFFLLIRPNFKRFWGLNYFTGNGLNFGTFAKTKIRCRNDHFLFVKRKHFVCHQFSGG